MAAFENIFSAFVRRQRLGFWLFAAAAGLIECWSYRFWIESDGVNYLDVAMSINGMLVGQRRPERGPKFFRPYPTSTFPPPFQSIRKKMADK